MNLPASPLNVESEESCTATFEGDQIPILDGILFITGLLQHVGIEVQLLTPDAGNPIIASVFDEFRNVSTIFSNSARNACSSSLSRPCWCSFLKSLKGTVKVFVPRAAQVVAPVSLDHPGLLFCLSIEAKAASSVSDSDRKLRLQLRPNTVAVGPQTSVCGSTNIALSLKPSSSLETFRPTALTTSFVAEFASYCVSHNSTQLHRLSNEAIQNLTDVIYNIWGPPDAMRTDEILACTQYALHNQSKLGSLLPACEFVPLSPAFVLWLGEDGVFLSEDVSHTAPLPCNHPVGGSTADAESDWDASTSDSDTLDHTENCASTSDFHLSDDYQSVASQVDLAIRRLGNKALPRFLWSSPKDATWVTADGSLMCTTAREVFLLMKCSNWIAHDLEKAFDHVVDPVLSLQSNGIVKPLQNGPSVVHLNLSEWVPVPDGEAFRLFYWGDRVLGRSAWRVESVCYYSDDSDASTHPSTRGCDGLLVLFNDVQRYSDLMCQFFHAHYYVKMPPALKRGVLDLCMTRTVLPVTKNGEPRQRLGCRLLKVSPWGSSTDPLLFTYSELRDRAWSTLKQNGYEERIAVENRCEEPCEAVELLRYVEQHMNGKRCRPETLQRYPQDVLECGESAPLAEHLADWMRSKSRLES